MQNLFPLPALIRSGEGTYTLHSNAPNFVRRDGEEIRRVGAFLTDCLRPATGFELPLLPAEESTNNGIRLTIDAARRDLAEEVYELVVEPNRIVSLRTNHPASGLKPSYGQKPS